MLYESSVFIITAVLNYNVFDQICVFFSASTSVITPLIPTHKPPLFCIFPYLNFARSPSFYHYLRGPFLLSRSRFYSAIFLPWPFPPSPPLPSSFSLFLFLYTGCFIFVLFFLSTFIFFSLL